MNIEAIFNTPVSMADGQFETLEVGSGVVVSKLVNGASVLIVSTVDIFVDVGEDPDCTTDRAVVTAGTPVLVALQTRELEKVALKAIGSATGFVTLYHL